jgi:hypothetical protein
MVPIEKIHGPWLPITSGPSPPTLQRPAGGWHIGRTPGVGGVQRGDFFLTKSEIRSRGGSNPRLEVLLESLNHYVRGPFAETTLM